MPDDELPQSICSNCTVKVQEAFSYKKMCEENDGKLREYVRARMECESIMFEHTNEQTNSPEIEKIHINDFFAHDGLLDENDQHDFVVDYGSDTRIDDYIESSDSEDDAIQDKKKTKKNNMTLEISTADASKSQYKMGEDFQVLNNARKVNGRYQCERCDKSLADRRTFLLHTR